MQAVSLPPRCLAGRSGRLRFGNPPAELAWTLFCTAALGHRRAARDSRARTPRPRGQNLLVVRVGPTAPARAGGPPPHTQCRGQDGASPARQLGATARGGYPSPGRTISAVPPVPAQRRKASCWEDWGQLRTELLRGRLCGRTRTGRCARPSCKQPMLHSPHCLPLAPAAI